MKAQSSSDLELTALEVAILSSLLNYPPLLDDLRLYGAADRLSGALGACARQLLEADPFVPVVPWVDRLTQYPGHSLDLERGLLLQNLSKWFSGCALSNKLLADTLDAASRGSAHDCVEEIRRARPVARRRTGAGARVR
jgi:hypothetical protein